MNDNTQVRETQNYGEKLISEMMMGQEEDGKASLDEDYQEMDNPEEDLPVKKKRLRKSHNKDQIQEIQDSSEEQSDIFDPEVIYDKLPLDRYKLEELLKEVKFKIKTYKNKFIHEQITNKQKSSYVGNHSIPICADVTKFDFQKLISKQLEVTGKQFDVIMMDPPWKLSTSQPSRGVAIQYDSLGDQAIGELPVPMLQENGFLLVWVINAKFQFTVNLMEKKWGYKVVDSIAWIKKTVNGKIAKGHGYYLQHAKQTCLVGIKGNVNFQGNVASDIIFSERRGQSQKPTQIYQYVQQLVPQGYYLEIFGRRNNLRNRWVTIGNQL